MPVLKDEIYLLRSQLDKVSRERNLLHDALKNVQTQVSKEIETTLDLQAQNYEIKLTELHSVIGELKKQLELHKQLKIDEETEEDEDEEYTTDFDTSIYEEQSRKNLGNFVEATGLNNSQQNPHNNANNTGTGIVHCQSADFVGLGNQKPKLDVCYIQTKESLFSEDDENRIQVESSHDLNSNNVSQKTSSSGGNSQKEKIKSRAAAADLGKYVLKTDLEEEKKEKELQLQRNQQHQHPTNFSNNHQKHQHQEDQLENHQETKTRLHRTKTSKGTRLLNMVSSSPEKKKKEEKNKRMPLVKLCPNENTMTTNTRSLDLLEQEEHHHENSDESSNSKSSTKLLLFSSLTPPQLPVPPSIDDTSTTTEELSQQSNKTFTASTTQESSINSLFHEVASIRKEHSLIRETLYKKESELGQTRFALESIAKERDFLKNKVNELEQMLKSPMSPTRTQYFHPSPISGNNYKHIINSHAAAAAVDSPRENNNEIQIQKLSESKEIGKAKEGEENDCDYENDPDCDSSSLIPIYKIAERVKLVHTKHASTTTELSPTTKNNILNNNYDSMDPKTQTHDFNKDKCTKKKEIQMMKKSFISGPELVQSLDSHNCNPEIIEQLLKPIQDDSRTSELHEQNKSCQDDTTTQIIKEFCIELEKLQSKLDHVSAQNNVLSLNLNDAKDRADDLSLLLGQYESNNMALQMILGHSDQVIEAYDVLVALLESELGQLLANCRAAGLGSPVPTPTSQNNTKNSSNTNNNNNSISQHLMITDGRSCHAEEITSSNINNSHGEESEEVYELLTRAYENRVVARNAAISLLHRSSPIIDSPSSSSCSPMSENNDTNGIGTTTTTTHCGDRLMILNFQQFPMNQNFHQLSPAAWEDISSGSQTMSSASSNNSGSKEHSNYHTPDEPFPCSDSSLFIQSNRRGTIEQRVRELIIGLKTERETVRSSVISDLCNNWNMDKDFLLHEDESSTSRLLFKSTQGQSHRLGFNKGAKNSHTSPCDILEARKLDLETAVIMQELMSLREERAELRAQLFLIEKDKSSLRTQIENYELGEVAYRAKIDYLSNEILELRSRRMSLMTNNEKTGEFPEAQDDNAGPCSSELNNNNKNNNGNTSSTTTKEATLKNQIRELVFALEKVTFTTEERERRHSGVVNEFKNANSILLQSLEETKRKYQCRIKKMEEQILSIIERHTLQSKLYREKISNLEIELQKSIVKVNSN